MNNKNLTLISMILFSLATLMASSNVGAKTSYQKREGHSYPTQIQLQGKNLKLNGIGLRVAKKFFMKFKVYTAALYLEVPKSDASRVIQSSEYKKLELTFLRNVDGDSIADAYKKGFKENGVSYKQFASEIEMMATKVNKVKEGQKIVFEFLNNKTAINHNGIKYEIAGKDFTKNILKLWLGTPPNKEVKSGMLGQ